MNNCKFLQHQHFCTVCKTQIDMKKLEREIFNYIYYEHKPELMPPLRDNDPMIIMDHGNDVEIVCCKDCFCRYLGIDTHMALERKS